MPSEQTHVEVEELMTLMSEIIEAHAARDAKAFDHAQAQLLSLPGMQLTGYERDALKLARYTVKLLRWKQNWRERP